MLGRVSAAAPATAIIASNTSSLPIEGLAVAVGEPARFLGVHWFNPPEWTPGHRGHRPPPGRAARPSTA